MAENSGPHQRLGIPLPDICLTLEPISAASKWLDCKLITVAALNSSANVLYGKVLVDLSPEALLNSAGHLAAWALFPSSELDVDLKTKQYLRTNLFKECYLSVQETGRNSFKIQVTNRVQYQSAGLRWIRPTGGFCRFSTIRSGKFEPATYDAWTLLPRGDAGVSLQAISDWIEYSNDPQDLGQPDLRYTIQLNMVKPPTRGTRIPAQIGFPGRNNSRTWNLVKIDIDDISANLTLEGPPTVFIKFEVLVGLYIRMQGELEDSKSGTFRSIMPGTLSA